jgi:hypothetical protein
VELRDSCPYCGAMTNTFSDLLDTFKNVGVSKAYGAAIQIGGEEIIPVALVSFGAGGGSEANEGASGGGGGGVVLPIGVYRKVGGQVAFRPNTITLLFCLVPVISAVGAAARRVIRAARP